jgi:dTDP-4-amino-4,6-dideoxygalactose transaminase
MSEKYTLTYPDIDEGFGRTKELLEELREIYKSGCAEGGGEILSLIDLLSSEERLSCVSMLPRQDSAADRLSREAAVFFSTLRHAPGPLLGRLAAAHGWDDIPLHVGCLGSATGAIFAALRANGIESGEVITTSLNYVGVPNAIALAGAVPRFVDVDPHTWCMDPKALESAVSAKTRAIILTHVNRMADLEPFHEVLTKKGLDVPVIQDASLAWGSTYQGMRPGFLNLGTGGVTVLSLAPSKIVCGFGGAVFTTHDLELLNRMVEIGYQGLLLHDQTTVGHHGANLRMNELSAAVAIMQLKRFDELVTKRRCVQELYDQHLEPAVQKGTVILQELGDEASVTHYMVLVPDRNALAERVYRKHGVLLYMWHAHHRQKLYAGSAVQLPVTDEIAGKITLLPFHTKLLEEDVAFICDALLEEL